MGARPSAHPPNPRLIIRLIAAVQPSQYFCSPCQAPFLTGVWRTPDVRVTAEAEQARADDPVVPDETVCADSAGAHTRIGALQLNARPVRPAVSVVYALRVAACQRITLVELGTLADRTVVDGIALGVLTTRADTGALALVLSVEEGEMKIESVNDSKLSGVLNK